MALSGSVVSIITLFLNNTIVNNLDGYEPKYLESSYYFFRNASGLERKYRPVDEDHALDGSTFFPKCCPPGFSYETENRECLESKGLPDIYEELNISADLIKSGLFECSVVVDRFVDKYYLLKSAGSGSLLVQNEVFPPGKFCLDNTVSRDVYVIRLCQEKQYCLNGTMNGTRDWCIHKCCPDGFGLENYKCELTSKTGLRVKNKSHIYENDEGYAFLYSTDLKCSVANWHEHQTLKFSIKTNGSLFSTENSREYTVDEYCLDTMYDTDSRRLTDMVILCEFNDVLYTKWTFLRICVILTCVCFAVTIGIYVFVYKLQKLIQQIITCFCVVDLIFWIMYACRIFYVEFGSFCTAFGYLYFYVLIARLSWLNVLSYEIWNIIGNPKASIGQTKKSSQKRIIFYSIYAMIVPAVFTLIFIMSHQEVYSLPEWLHPRINSANCAIDTRALDNNYGHLHLFIPVLILIIINLVYFIKTLLHFLKIRSELKNISADTTSNSKEKMIKTNNKKGIIILKLGLVMGVTWIYYLVSYINTFTPNIVLKVIEEILLFPNLLEGLYFFIIFAVKWKIVKAYLYKMHILKRKSATSNDTHNSVSTESVSGVAMKSFK